MCLLEHHIFSCRTNVLTLQVLRWFQGWSMETQESLPISDVMYILFLVWNIVYIVYHPSLYHFLPCTEQLIEWKYMVYFIMNQIVIMEVPQHILVIATSHEIKKFMTFSILSWHMYSHLSAQFCDVSWYWLWRKMSVTN